jgi:hypothetical protein
MKDLRRGGAIACCPERKMLSAKEWRDRAVKAEAERDNKEAMICLMHKKLDEAADKLAAMKERCESAEASVRVHRSGCRRFGRYAVIEACDNTFRTDDALIKFGKGLWFLDLCCRNPDGDVTAHYGYFGKYKNRLYFYYADNRRLVYFDEYAGIDRVGLVKRLVKFPDTDQDQFFKRD